MPRESGGSVPRLSRVRAPTVRRPETGDVRSLRGTWTTQTHLLRWAGGGLNSTPGPRRREDRRALRPGSGTAACCRQLSTPPIRGNKQACIQPAAEPSTGVTSVQLKVG
ncbi:hypothetical protein NDU88_005752 [Pleurodeles waltl]|uniref:Uncharacterized protein n=1 Tax=Pleurodeles waltl TaxID=8319 RepID=A0AAV7MA98_PLEWA|nr:hypothetical protein NDU88_005752 [Pleurodeles waltl]